MEKIKYLGGIMMILLVTNLSMAQNYTIIHVKGDMKLADGTTLRRGSRVSEESKLIFGTEDAAAAAISSTKGRFIIKKGGQNTGQDDAFYLLKAVLNPVKGRMSTRSGKLNNMVALQKHFGDEPLAFLGEKEYVDVSSDAFPQDYQHFFFLRYKYIGETINKKLLSDKQNMIWDKKEIFSVDGTAIEPEKTSDHTLYYLGEDGKPVKIAEVSFDFVPSSEVEILIAGILLEEGLTASEKTDLATDLITELYGKPQRATVASYFQ